VHAPAVTEARRRCLEAPREEAVPACQEALEAGLSASAAAVVRQALVSALVELARYDEAVAALREGARLMPGDAEAQLKLGSGLLHLGGNASEAIPVLQASLRLRGDDARAYGELGLALHRLGQHAEAVAAFAEAERLDAGYFEDRPAARAAYEASKRGESWR
jgi:tetratricopeptide (TPR) repeat protein